MAITVRYIFSYLSPYSYLADCRLDEVLRPFDVELDYMPVLPPPGEDGKRMKPRADAERTYMTDDVPRVARRFGIPYTTFEGYPDCEPMTLGFHAVRELGGDWLAYHGAAYSARFAQGLDPAAPSTLDGLARVAGVEVDDFLAAIKTDAIQTAYLEKARDAVQCGIFGVPIFVLPSGERFWGQDRLDYLALALEDGRV